jgi:hypothetical protein
MSKLIRKSIGYKLIIWILLVICIIVFWWLGTKIFSEPIRIIRQDFAQMWAAGKLVLNGKNLYAPGEISELRFKISGIHQSEKDTPLFYSPPWVIPLVMLFSGFDYPMSRLLWLLVNILLMFISSNWLWEIYNGEKKYRWVAWLAAFTFTPAISVLSKGQISTFVLFGIVGFLYHVQESKTEWLAGVFAALVSVKPQIAYLFWPALLVWTIYQRKWNVIAGFLFIMLVGISIPLILNPNIITHYFEMVLNYSPTRWATPTIGAYLRMSLGIEKFWLQFISPLFGLIWITYYLRKNFKSWCWNRTMPAIIFASLLTVPYGWTYDAIILLAAIIPVWVLQIESGSRKWISVFGVSYLSINLADYILHRHRSDEFFIWLVPLWFIWYLSALKIVNE